MFWLILLYICCLGVVLSSVVYLTDIVNLLGEFSSSILGDVARPHFLCEIFSWSKMHCAGPSGLFGREFVSVDRSVNKHSFQTCSGSLPWMLWYIAELNLWKRWCFVIGSLWADPDWFTVASDAPINSFVTGDWFVLWNWVSGTNFGGIHFLYLTDEK